MSLIVVFSILIIGVLFVIARRALRLVMRLVLFGGLVLVLLAASLAWWYYGSDRSQSSKPYGGSPAKTRRNTSR